MSHTHDFAGHVCSCGADLCDSVSDDAEAEAPLPDQPCNDAGWCSPESCYKEGSTFTISASVNDMDGQADCPCAHHNW